MMGKGTPGPTTDVNRSPCAVAQRPGGRTGAGFRRSERLMVRPGAFLFLMTISLLALPGGGRARAAAERPNVVVILADDLGYSDLGCYGGEIRTPNLEGLAAGGLRFTQFYNTARCWPTRAAILTGYYAQQVRRDKVPGVPSGGQGMRPTWAKLLPEKLRPLGYRSYHSGKWHVDGTPLTGGF